jgi:hypothetical protein
MPRGRRGRPAGALYGHCQRTYGALNSEALNLADAPTDVRALVPADQVGRVWIGNLVPRMEQMGYAAYYYDRVKSALLAMGCLLQLRRGVKLRPGAWLLLQPPTEQRYRALGAPLESRDEEHRQRHDQVIGRWLEVAGRYHPALLAEAMDAGQETIGDLLEWLATLPEPRLRTLPICLGFRGGPHVCLTELDPLGDRSAGSQVRRAAHLAKLAAGE